MPGPAYTTPNALRSYLPLDLPSTLNNSLLSATIERWSRYVDDYLASVYRVPFPNYPATPGMITVITEMLSIYWLYVVMGMSSEKDDPRQSLWKRAHDLLEGLRSMAITIDKVPGAEDNILRSTGPMTAGPAKGAASMANQARELGSPHGKTLGGLPWFWREEEGP